MDIEELKTLVKKHALAKAKLDKAKIEEMTLRTQICEMIAGPVDKRREGANTLADAAQYGFKKLSVTQPINRKVDAGALEAHKADIGDELFSQLFRFKPEVVAAPFRAVMPGENRRLKLILGSIVTEEPGTPSLELK